MLVVAFGVTVYGCSKNAANNTANQNMATTSTVSTNATASPAPSGEIVKKEEISKTNDETQTGKNVIAVETLTTDYEKSQDDVRKKYDGKEISVRGFASIPPTITDDSDGSGLISITVKKDLLKDVKCWFSKADAEEFKKIKGDQFITVKGIFDGELFPELKFCKLVKIE